MNQEFSANRQASRYSGMPWRAVTSRTARMFAMETGWPPPELLVTVSMTSGTSSAPSVAISCSSAATSILPLNGSRACVSAAAGSGRSTARAPVNSIFARVVSKCVLLGTTWPGRHITVNRIRSAARPWCVGIMWVNPVRSSTTAFKPKKALASRVGFVAAHHGRPLAGRHGAGAGIGEKIDQNVGSAQFKQVISGLFEKTFALISRRAPQRLDTLDAERLDDSLHRLPSWHTREY